MKLLQQKKRERKETKKGSGTEVKEREKNWKAVD